jgi:hypothetical protein
VPCSPGEGCGRVLGSLSRKIVPQGDERRENEAFDTA